MKKILVFIAILFIFSFSANAKTFKDVTAANPFQPAITYLAEKNIITGYNDGNFRPFHQINRAEFLKLVLESAKIKISATSSNCFPDVPNHEWHSAYICTAKNLKLINGYPDGTFKPNRNINKVEALTIISKTFAWNTTTIKKEPLFSDTPANEWYIPYLRYAKSKNFLPDSGEKFYPQNPISRGLTAEILYRIFTIEEEIVKDPFTVYTLEGLATDAVNGLNLESANITIFNANDKPIVKSGSSRNGTFLLYDIPIPENGYILFSKNNYYDLKLPIKEIQTDNLHIALSQIFTKLAPGELRIVLTWGKNPVDLDAHIITPNSEELFFMRRIASDLSVFLDTDSSNKNGTETFTIKKLKNGTYEMFVERYAGKDSFAQSEARIEVYDINGLVKIYYAPEGAGKIWKVFNLTGKGELIDFNQIGSCEILENVSSICP